MKVTNDPAIVHEVELLGEFMYRSFRIKMADHGDVEDTLKWAFPDSHTKRGRGFSQILVDSDGAEWNIFLYPANKEINLSKTEKV